MIKALLVLLFLFCATEASGAIVFDAATGSGSDTGDTSFSFNHTAAAGSSREAFACISLDNPSSTPETITAVTYNSVAMTEIACVLHGTGVTGRTCAYRLTAPSTGTNAFAATFSGVVDVWAAGIATYSGVDQSTPFDTASTDGDAAAAESSAISISSAAGDLVLSCLGVRDAGITITNNGDQTATLFTADANASRPTAKVTSAPGAASVNMSYDWSAAGFEYYGHIAVNMNAAAAAPTARRRRPIILQ